MKKHVTKIFLTLFSELISYNLKNFNDINLPYGPVQLLFTLHRLN